MPIPLSSRILIRMPSGSGVILDSLLYLGQRDERLARLMSRLGYELIVADESTPLAPLLNQQRFDLIILDSALQSSATDLFEYLRSDDTTKQIPLIMITSSQLQMLDPEIAPGHVEYLVGPYRPGQLVSKIATQLRLRKMAGGDPNTATLAEVNASLRDFNTRMQKEMEEARELQESLLPQKLPQHPGLDLAVYYQPLQDVGGDWYFIEQVPSGSLLTVIADVTGHGLAAAFIGSMTKLAYSAALKEDPGELLTAINQLMTPQLPAGRFVTMAATLFNPVTGEIKVARAGHPAALLVSTSAGASVQPVGSEGFAIGFVEDAQYQSVSHQLAPNDSLIMITDGISEAQDRANKMFGAARLMEAAIASSAMTAREMAGGILRELHQFCDGRLIKDDVSLIVIKRRAIIPKAGS